MCRRWRVLRPGGRKWKACGAHVRYQADCRMCRVTNCLPVKRHEVVSTPTARFPFACIDCGRAFTTRPYSLNCQPREVKRNA